MSEEDYAAMFESGFSSATLACLYFPSDDAARAAVSKLPEGYMGLLSTSGIYVQSAGDVFTSNVLWYVALIAASLLVGVLIGIIFMRSVKIYQADFAVYRTLGIPNKRIARCRGHSGQQPRVHLGGQLLLHRSHASLDRRACGVRVQ